MGVTVQCFNIQTTTHEHPVNRLIHRFCAPLATVSIIGLLWSLTVPEGFTRISPALNWGSAFSMPSIVHYFITSITLNLGLTPVILALMVGIRWLAHQ